MCTILCPGYKAQANKQQYLSVTHSCIINVQIERKKKVHFGGIPSINELDSFFLSSKIFQILPKDHTQ
jgi:hypothetical protein